ncbi:type II toxin-antitoxin system Phd/YefM family antitoxin [Cellulomonas bogoriensis]|uniref:Antitoxin n=1 Tax=Cellulomonas bogoriensis 69B4 = DSM 16987 TaxID=1386082 RepID=A0A0A0C058_9CELL|nr:type II toxin-antitoxin system prevent-host-death family antitoxin [Cellulomonas bogoriensis]KGM14053.1 prevent-host-death protein [Cellulomonas bogoriensis 69B4 = DSM 16987]
MENIGIRELRQRASDVIREVESGRALTVTVNGRAAARIVPLASRQWRTWDEVGTLLAGPGAPDLRQELAELDLATEVVDPFDRHA